MVQFLVEKKKDRTLTAGIMNYFKKLVHFDTRFIKLILENIDLKQFILCNIIISNQEHIATSSEFLRTLSTNSTFAKTLYDILMGLMKNEFKQVVPPKSGYDAIIGMMHWVAPLDINNSLSVFIDILYNHICLSTLKDLQDADCIAFRTRFSQVLSGDDNPVTNFADHYPYDKALFKFSASKEKEQAKKASYQSSDKAKLIKSALWNYQKDQARRTQEYQTSFAEETHLQFLQIYFGIQTKELNRLDIFVTADGKIMTHMQLEEWEFARYAYPHKGNENQKHKKPTQSIESLQLNCNFKVKDLKVQLVFGHTASSLPNKKSHVSLPETMIEAYGDDPATNYESVRNEFKQKMDGKPRKVGQSVTTMQQKGSKNDQYQYLAAIYAEQDNQDTVLVPKQGNASSKDGDSSQINTSPSVGAKEIDLSEYHAQQQELKEIATKTQALSKKDSNQAELKAKAAQLLVKIKKFQNENLIVNNLEENIPVTGCLQYLNHYCIDLALLMINILKDKSITSQQLNQIMKSILPGEKEPIVKISLILFTQLVAMERGNTRWQIHTLITESFWPRMNKEQKFSLFCDIVDNFLTKPAKDISQKAIINALDKFEIPNGDIIGYLVDRLGLSLEEKGTDKLAPGTLVIRVSSLLFLSLKSVQRLRRELSQLNTKNSHFLIKNKIAKKASQDVQVSKNGIEYTKKRQSASVPRIPPLATNQFIASDNLDHGDNKQATQNLSPIGKLNYNLQFVACYKLSVWIAQRPQHDLSDQQRAALLIQSFKVLNELQKEITSVKFLKRAVQNGHRDLLDLCLCVLNISYIDNKLKDELKIFLDGLTDPIILTELNNYVAAGKSAFEESNKYLSQIKGLVKEEKEIHYSVMRHWSNQIQELLIWMIQAPMSKKEIANSKEKLLTTETSKAVCHQRSIWAEKLEKKYSGEMQLWIDDVYFLLGKYMQDIKILRVIQTTDLVNKMPALPDYRQKEDDKQASLKLTRSLSEQLDDFHPSRMLYQSPSIQIIRCLTKFLLDCSLDHSQLNSDQLSQVWTLILKSLQTIDIAKLVQGKLIDTLIKAYLASNLNIRQAIYQQLLNVTELIVKDKTQQKTVGQLIANFIFQTLQFSQELPETRASNATNYSICQGWLDIMIQSKVGRALDYGQKNIYVQMGIEDTAEFFEKSALFLNQKLNLGSFEGCAGASKQIVMDLNLAQDMLLIAFNLKLNDGSNKQSIVELQRKLDNDPKIEKKFERSLDLLITWLFLNARNAKEQSDSLAKFYQISNQQTPATQRIKNITEIIENFLHSIPQSGSKKAVLVALGSLTRVVRQLNSSISKAQQSNKLSIDYLISLNQRTNQYFIKFISNWIKTEAQASYFVFELGGFEFLLDIIGKSSVESTKKTESSSIKNAVSALLAQLDISDLGEIIPLEPTSEEQKSDNEEEQIDDTPPHMTVSELAGKNMILHYDSANHKNVSAHNKTDWSLHKRAARTRQLITSLMGQQLSEYQMLFKLQKTSLIREIQIGFTNFWQSDHEAQTLPLEVFIQAGLEKDKLTTICNLNIVEDEGFASVQTTIFGKNLQTFEKQVVPFANVEEQIENQLNSIGSFEANFIQINMRRHAISCIENSPVACRFNKQPAFALSFISILGHGYDENLKKAHLRASKHIKAEQEKTGLEILAKICSSNFSSVLQIIANEPRSINKIKSQFSKLSNLVKSKKSSIEPIFIAFCKYNSEIGDWMIQELLQNENFKDVAILTANLIMSEVQEIHTRLKMLQDHLSSKISKENFNLDDLEKLSPAIMIFLQIVRMCSPLLNNSKKIDLEVNEEQLIKLIEKSNPKSNALEYKTQINVLRQYIILVLCPPSPFINTKQNALDFGMKLLDKIDSCQNKFVIREMQYIVGLIAISQGELAKTVFERRILMDDLMKEPKESKEVQTTKKHAISFWKAVSLDPWVRLKIQEERIAFKLYSQIQALRSSEQGKSSQEFLEDAIDFIKQLIVSDSKMEAEFAEIIMKDLDALTQSRDMDFVNKIFIPLIKLEKTLPITFNHLRGVRQQQEQKQQAVADDDQIVETSQIQISIPSTTDDSGLKLESQILQDSHKQPIKTAIKQIVGNSAGSDVSKKVLGNSWKKLFSYRSDDLSSKEGLMGTYAWKKMLGAGPHLILQKGTDKGNNIVSGVFFQGRMPEIPATLPEEDGEQAFEIQHEPGDFSFLFVNGQLSFYTMIEDHHSKPFEIFLTYESFVLTYAASFIVMSTDLNLENEFEYDQSGLQQVTINGVSFDQTAYQPDNITNKFTEVFKLDSLSSENLNDADKEELESESNYPRINSLMSNIVHPWIIQNSAQNYYRSDSIYHVPAHLNLSQIGHVLLAREGDMSLWSGAQDLQMMNAETVKGTTLQKLFDDQIEAKRKNIDVTLDGITDLKYDKLTLFSNSKEIEALKPVRDCSIGLEAMHEVIAANYPPQMTFYEQFEQKGGVSKIIQVALDSLKLWKKKELADSWELWLQELKSFSNIPLFFQMFLKNHKCKDLLFKILAGAPDQDSQDQMWDQEQKDAVQVNFKILSEVFSVSSGSQLREQAIECGLFQRILDRLSRISGENPRELDEQVEEEEDDAELEAAMDKGDLELLRKESKKNTEKKARKGVGYSAKDGVRFDVTAYLNNKKMRDDQIKILVDICSRLLTSNEWEASQYVSDLILTSALLPILEQSFRNAWLDMAKTKEVYQSYLALVRSIASQKNLLKCLTKIDPKYKPPQRESIHTLVGKIKDLAQNVLFCLGQQKEVQDEEGPEILAKDVLDTYKIIDEALADYLSEDKSDQIKNALQLPVPAQYRALLENLRFDYMNMRNDSSDYVHHYKHLAQSNDNPPSKKMIRLAQELADLSNGLPCEHTNSIFVRVDKERVDMIKAMICGAANTPYAHGCFEFDIFCENNYPNCSPKMNLMTTGSQQIRFNPNLYACGKVCLSLLGTWRGNATENWDPKLSTILQVLVSVQAIIMSEEVYFNEPGFEGEIGTPEGERKNEGYMNVVRYGNVKWAMLDKLKNPSKGFEDVIKRHFYVKKKEILTEVNYWLELPAKNEASYTGLIYDHNPKICEQFKKSKAAYKDMLKELVDELTDQLNKLDTPKDISNMVKNKNETKKKQDKKKIGSIREGEAALDEIDVADEKVQAEGKDIDVTDDAVKDRWSRYIGAMGVEAVAKQAAANIFLSGANGLGIEIAKNLVLSGCKSFTVHDPKQVEKTDLSAQFFINEEADFGEKNKDKKLSRAQACIDRLQALNFYVKCNKTKDEALPKNEADLMKDPWNMHKYDVVILCEQDQETAEVVDSVCRKNGVKFIMADCYGGYCRLFNDFGDKFEVLDKNGEELQDCNISKITNDKEAVVEILQTNKHKLEDGDEVLLTEVQGMDLLEGQTHQEEAFKKLTSINETIHKVKVMTPYSFKIGDTTKYSEYKGKGIVKQLRTKVEIKSQSLADSFKKNKDEIPLDQTLAIVDFEKLDHPIISHLCFLTLEKFKKSESRMPKPWDYDDAAKFVKLAEEVGKELKIDEKELKDEEGNMLNQLYSFPMQAQGVFNPLCAFLGGYVAQEAVKAITQKFTPTHQLFYYDATEAMPKLTFKDHIKPILEKPESERSAAFAETAKNHFKTLPLKGDRYDGLRMVIGDELLKKLHQTNLFMVGAGAIGCELLKNYAMLGLGSSKEAKKTGSIVLTDPDVIEVSNLNRQFLFREKHLRKPKSSTAAAAAIQMNKDLKGNIVARLDKVHDGTRHIFSDSFFENLTVVTNALDNVAARTYVDMRCVSAKTPLLESGTLGPKGHVQVIIPHMTESYGSMKDPEDNNDIPICTLKMFPEETLHCIEWARDLFGKLFTQGPKSLLKILEEGPGFQPTSQQDMVALREGIEMLESRPKDFQDCIKYARQQFEKYFNHDIKQLLHVYPLDAKTKEGNLFWSLPKRAPTPAVFNKETEMHQNMIASMACLRAVIFNIKIPSETPRKVEFKKDCAEKASKVEVTAFKADEQAAKAIQQDINKQEKKDGEDAKDAKEQQQQESEPQLDLDEAQILKTKFTSLYNELTTALKGKDGKIKWEDVIKSEEFEKDDDKNFHIDFMHSLGNCRSINYTLEPMDWIQVKLKAGRIVPAMATTTASIAGLQTLELIKVIKGCKKVEFKNAFLNLAAPFFQATEPGDVEKIKLVEGIEVTLWTTWEIEGKDKSLKEIISKVEEKYAGLEVRDVLHGNKPIFFSAIMNAAGKEKEREALLNQKLIDILEISQEDLKSGSVESYIDLAITVVKKGEADSDILKGVPPLRVYLSK